MASLWKDINSYTRGQKRALIAIWSIILTTLIISLIKKTYFTSPPNIPLLDSAATALVISKLNSQQTTELSPFNPNTYTNDQLIESGLPRRIADNITKLKQAGKKFKTASDLRKIYGMTDSLFEKIAPFIVIPAQIDDNENTHTHSKKDKTIELTQKFDPNNAQLPDLIAIGLPEAIAKNITKYRQSGGKFNTPDDLLKLYTIDTSSYKELEPYIHIETSETIKVEVEQIELNTTTARELSRTTGIEIKISYKILNYRDKLGGFIHFEQLSEIEDLPSSILEKLRPTVWIDTLQIAKIDINNAEYSTLIRHPYATKNFVSNLIRYRNFVKQIKNTNELIKNKVTIPTEISRLAPYLKYD